MSFFVELGGDTVVDKDDSLIAIISDTTLSLVFDCVGV
jgi:hypothetical protein